MRAFRGALNGADGDAQALADVVSLETRLFALGHARFGAAHVDDYVGAFDALDNAVHKLADARVIFVVDGVALGFAHLLQDHLLGRLRGDAAEDFRRLILENFAAGLDAGLLLAGVGEGDFAQRIGDFIHYCAYGKNIHVAGFGVEFRAEIFLGLVIFAGSDNHSIFDGRDDNIGLDVLFAADLLDCLVEQTCHF